ncbi:MAG: hypothetical protein HQ471_07760 [Flavobacteriales bacterium]|nr:hypothetical protein [Flavobacteriales bacterium]
MAITVKSLPLNEMNYSFTEGVSTDSATIMKSINVNVSEVTLDREIEVTINGTVITLLIEDEKINTPIDVYFINKEGAQQSLTFFQKRTDKMDVTKETYDGNLGQPSAGFHQFIDFNIQAKSTFAINSGFILETNNEDFKQLMLSERVWVRNGILFTPINIQSKTITYQNRKNNRLINYAFDMGYSYNEINNV